MTTHRPMNGWNLLWFTMCLLITTTVHASDPQPDRVRAPRWTEGADPAAHRALALLQQARVERASAARALPMGWQQLCERLSEHVALLDLPGFAQRRNRVLGGLLGEAMQRLTHLDNAIARLTEARALHPDQPDVLLALGLALAAWERPGALERCATERRADEAIAILEELRRLHPHHEATTVHFELAVLYTREHAFAKAARAYAEGLPLELHPDQFAVMLGNWAEVTMLAGDLVTAVTLYRRALAAASDERARLLSMWGLAVALDRLGDRDAALDHATRALNTAGGAMAVLRSEGVFFEPPCELHYYEALGYEASASVPGADRVVSMQRAIASWQAYFRLGGEQTQWADAARENQRRVQALLTETTKPPRRSVRGDRSRSSASGR